MSRYTTSLLDWKQDLAEFLKNSISIWVWTTGTHNWNLEKAFLYTHAGHLCAKEFSSNIEFHLSLSVIVCLTHKLTTQCGYLKKCVERTFCPHFLHSPLFHLVELTMSTKASFSIYNGLYTLCICLCGFLHIYKFIIFVLPLEINGLKVDGPLQNFLYFVV